MWITSAFLSNLPILQPLQSLEPSPCISLSAWVCLVHVTSFITLTIPLYFFSYVIIQLDKCMTLWGSLSKCTCMQMWSSCMHITHHQNDWTSITSGHRISHKIHVYSTGTASWYNGTSCTHSLAIFILNTDPANRYGQMKVLLPSFWHVLAPIAAAREASPVTSTIQELCVSQATIHKWHRQSPFVAMNHSFLNSLLKMGCFVTPFGSSLFTTASTPRPQRCTKQILILQCMGFPTR